MFVFTSFLRKGQCSGENVTAIHLKKKFPLSETSQEFQIRLGDIRKQLKSNLKSPPTFHLLFLPSNYCSWSMYWQIFPKWAIICLKTENFLVKMKLFSLKNEFIVTLQKKKKKAQMLWFPKKSSGLKFHPEILLGQGYCGWILKLRHLPGEVPGHCSSPGWIQVCSPFVFHIHWWLHITAWVNKENKSVAVAD